ncbi:MAG: SAM-dependent methyltransferase [Pseudomonadota bacterium]
MDALSRQIVSSQPGPHPRLAQTIARHEGAEWRKPEQQVDKNALHTLDAALEDWSGPIILDSFCGTGMSTNQIARAHPETLVVGVDKSLHRLERAETKAANALYLRAHCEAVWRHLVSCGRRLDQHFLFYPNPWPKPGHLGRRVHGHPAFTLLPILGGDLELRSNWQIYVEEFGIALHLLGHISRIGTVDPDAPMTLFEKKYRESGHRLWRLNVRFS